MLELENSLARFANVPLAPGLVMLVLLPCMGQVVGSAEALTWISYAFGVLGVIGAAIVAEMKEP